jgi:hypothetical protein
MGQRILSCRAFGLFLAFACATLLAACGGDGGGGSAPASSIASVTITSPTLLPKEGDSVQLTAVARDQYGTVVLGTTATWSVSDTNLAAVSPAGVLQAFHEGSVVVTATIEGVSGLQTFTISPIRVSVTIGSTKEVVFRWATDRCDDRELLDQPARFVRAEDGSLVHFGWAGPRTYLSRGADFGSLKRDCSQPVLVNANRTTPESYENAEWLWAVYREGSRWHALIHNEFHDTSSPTCLSSDPVPVQMCTYTSITYAVSTDGARSFSKPAPPAHVVAPAPKAWAPPPISYPSAQYAAVEGYFEPNNIVRGTDGYYYSFMRAVPAQNWQGKIAMCAMRTDSLGDPASWRAWDGSGFNLRLISPYVTGSPAPVCTMLETFMISGQITYNTYLNRYMHVAMALPDESDGRPVCGIYFVLSADLIHWSRPQLLAEAQFSWCRVDLQRPTVIEPASVAYPSIVDHNDTTINFERAGRSAHLYYSRLSDTNIPRDLIRVQVTFTRID